MIDCIDTDSLETYVSFHHHHVAVLNLLADIRHPFKEQIMDFQAYSDASPSIVSSVTQDDVSNRSDLFMALKNLLLMTKSKRIGLILHIDAHGTDLVQDDRYIPYELEIESSGEHVSLDELRNYFCDLFLATRGRLTICCSSCWGMGLCELVSFKDNCRAPYSNMIAPQSGINTGDLTERWKEIYRSIYNDKDVIPQVASTGFFFESISERVSHMLKNIIFNDDIQIKALEKTGLIYTNEQLSNIWNKSKKGFVYSFFSLNQDIQIARNLNLGKIASQINDNDLLIASLPYSG